jgi:pectate lyase
LVTLLLASCTINTSGLQVAGQSRDAGSGADRGVGGALDSGRQGDSPDSDGRGGTADAASIGTGGAGGTARGGTSGSLGGVGGLVGDTHEVDASVVDDPVAEGGHWGGSGGSTGATSLMAGSGGAVASGGSLGLGGATDAGSMMGAGGVVVTGGSPGADGGPSAGNSRDQCKPVGWATLSGRTGGVVSVTGGGSATPVVVKSFSELQKYASDSHPQVIHIDGTLGVGWRDSAGDRLTVTSNKTIVGQRPGTVLKAAVNISSASNVIVRNIVIHGPGSSSSTGWDNLTIDGTSKNIWIDHCEFWDGQDGNADVTKGADNVTFTWNIFGYAIPGHTHNLSNLVGSSDSEPVSVGKLNITYMFNWWKAAYERQPRCRYGHVHVVNNLYTGDATIGASALGVSNGLDCNVLTENNHFIDQTEPINLSKQAGKDSVQQAVGNIFENCSGNHVGNGTAFTPPYEYKSFMAPASEVKAVVEKFAGATLPSPTVCAH